MGGSEQHSSLAERSSPGQEESNKLEAFVTMITINDFRHRCRDDVALPPSALPQPAIPGGDGHLRGVADEEAGSQIRRGQYCRGETQLQAVAGISYCPCHSRSKCGLTSLSRIYEMFLFPVPSCARAILACPAGHLAHLSLLSTRYAVPVLP